MIVRDMQRGRSNEALVSCPLPDDINKVDMLLPVDAKAAEVKLVARQSKSTRLFLFDPKQGRTWCSSVTARTS